MTDLFTMPYAARSRSTLNLGIQRGCDGLFQIAVNGRRPTVVSTGAEFSWFVTADVVRETRSQTIMDARAAILVSPTMADSPKLQSQSVTSGAVYKSTSLSKIY